MKGKKQIILVSVFLFLPFFSCARIYIDCPDKEEWTQKEPRDKEFYREEIRKMEKNYPERYGDRQRYHDEYPQNENRRDYRQPLRIRQGLEQIAEFYNLDPEEFNRAYEEAIDISRTENYRIWENLRLRILQNDGSINRISQRYARISGWLHETKVSGQTIAIFIPASKSFILGIVEDQIAVSRRQETPAGNYRKPDNQRRISPESDRQSKDIIEEVDPVSDEEAEEYYRRQQKGGQ